MILEQIIYEFKNNSFMILEQISFMILEQIIYVLF